MKRPRELHLIIGWLIYFVGEVFALRLLITGGWVLSAYFPDSPFMQHVCVLSGIAAHLLGSYFLFRLVVKYLVRNARDAPNPTN